jgi:hypothetical protein
MMPETYIKAENVEIDELYPRIRSFLEKDILDINIDGTPIRGFRTPDARSIWIRDHSDMMRGYRYFEPDLKSAVQHFADTQAASGRIFDYFTTFPEKLPCERENWTKYVRVPVEADVEFRFVKGAWLAWQASGDDAWIERLLPGMERALEYARTHPWRWEESLGLVKRPYTIDTWDFAYTAGRHDWLQFQIDEHTFWGIMHGDNSGYYEAFRIMERLYRYFENDKAASLWQERAETLKEHMNRVCWNGSFYRHFVKLSDVTIPGVDEEAQLSLSNPMNINRGVADHDMAAAILREYRKRGKEGRAFTEWFSVDPPFPEGVFGDDKLVRGAYVNGGIMPLVGGELARAAFEHGFESYGVEILKKYHEMISARGETYLWYFPDGSPSTVETSTSPEATPTDGWGSSAMLYALVEGLAGVEDRLKRFERACIAPRWPAAGVDRAEVRVAYAASGVAIGYTFRSTTDHIALEVEAPGSDIYFHVLLPVEAAAKTVLLDGEQLAFENQVIEKSRYANFWVPKCGRAIIEIKW